MKINRLNWDSNFFGKEIGEIFLDIGDDLSFEGAKDFEVIYVKQKQRFPIEVPFFLQYFSETKIIFIKQNLKKKTNDFTEIRDVDNEPRFLEFFRELAYESGKQSRFLLDENFGKSYFHKLYDEWIINSLNKKFAEKIFYIEKDNKAIGFVTLQRSNHTGKIGLIATHPNFQGNGLGTRLLDFVENYCLENSINHLEIPTQKENLQACSFYAKLGYEIKDEIIIKHFWRNDI